ncbi:MAG: MFS transporter [Allosphingosinicella sp.]
MRDTRQMRSSGSTLSPLGHPLFLTLWIATLTANFGNLVLAVGVQWQMTAIDGRADMVALVWSAMSLPMLLLSLLGGAIADQYDRRLVLMTAYGLTAAVSVTLAWLAFEGLATPWLLIGATFALGVTTAFYTPATQASIGSVVPRGELAGAASLNILGFNVARTLGPAAGGAIVALGGPMAAFLCNLVACLAAVSILAFWHPPRPEPRPGASILRSMTEGLRVVRDRPELKSIVLRALSFTVAGSAAWALMPLVARDLIGGGPEQFGLLLGALGLGAVIGAAAAHEVRRRFDGETLVRTAALVYGAACLVVATGPGIAISFAVLVVGGAGWVQALSGFSVAGQVWAPRALVGRVTATVSTMTFGGIALGSWLWGRVAESAGVATAVAGSGGAMILVVLLGLVLPMPGLPHAPLEDA